MTIPNLLTLLRVATIPCVVWLYIEEWYVVSGLLLVVSLLTDYVDGALARRWGQLSALGALLDPVADKIVVLSYFGFLWYRGLAPAWFVVLIVARNMAQLMAIPILSWWLQRPFHVRPKWPAKWATAASMVLIPLLLYAMPWQLAHGMRVAHVAMPVLALLEMYLLLTYLPRLVQIARGTHDTFE